MPENRTLAEQVEVQKAKVATEQQRLEELLVRLRTEHSDDKRAYNELLCDCGKIIEKKLDRPLTKDDLFRFERFLDSRSVTDFFPEWMNKPLNKSKRETK
ncbi:MAG: hypothetical protein K5869_03885 [Saccharofermentans sp.]|nr:hypothetical protein [Saccharofermentans sp.]